MSSRDAPQPPEKVCRVCGRRFAWRAKWAEDWDQVRHCSSGCRRRGLRPVDERLEDALLDLLARRARDATVCPSEAARLVAGPRGEVDEAAWRALMEPARMAARRLVARGEVEVTQRGRVVDPSTAKGPVRVRRPR
ncbi:DUF3253 domain-containing protein [Aquipuribacter sp. SD81]|uniref:DUF3253 domain-containing protein n=1 Tax=Aquipuribacter sp. SD81 TaxID=3127703 RepID=UPI003019C83D